MKIKRFIAGDMRQAMGRVRDEQGPDAVILSSRRIEEGIEIIAAIDYDEALIRQAVAQAGAGEARTEAASRPAPAQPDAGTATRNPAPAVTASSRDTSAARTRPAAVPGAGPTPPSPRQAEGAPQADRSQPPELAGMKHELAELRKMLESQFSSLAWTDLGRRNPVRARVLRDFTRMGLDPDIAGDLAARLPEHPTPAQSRYLPMGLLAERVRVREREPIDEPGAIALVGATGVGKTTSLAKLAARYVLRHGPRQVALIGTDEFRVGAEEQLFHYGRLLGVPVYAAGRPSELIALLERLADHRLVLIDTPGLGHGDSRVGALGEALLSAGPRIRSLLVLAANAQSGALEQTARAYARFRPGGCVLTKLDETSVLGGALSVLVRHGLCVDYIANGQRVPEDIDRPDPHRLVCRALRMSAGGDAADDLQMAERFGLRTATFA